MDLKSINVNNDPLLDNVFEEVKTVAGHSAVLMKRAEDLYTMASRFYAYSQMSRAALMVFGLGVQLKSKDLIDQSQIIFEQIATELNARPIFEFVREQEVQ